MSGTGPKAVVLLSGGVDSSTTMALAKAEGYDIYALSFSYGQRHYRELASAKMVAEHLGARRHLILGFDLREIGGSALTGDLDVPKSSEGSRPLGGDQEIPPTYVPARNTVFLSFALAWAEVLAACDIFIGANAVDYSGYPDCRPEYLAAFEKMANLGTKASVEGRVRFRIHAPLVFMTKGEIISKGASLGLDYSLTWSCYDPQPSSDPLPIGTGRWTSVPPEELRYVPCGQCDSCLFRAAGFKEAGIADPLTSAEIRRD